MSDYNVRKEGSTFIFTGPAKIRMIDTSFDDLLRRATQNHGQGGLRDQQIRAAFEAAAKEYKLFVAA